MNRPYLLDKKPVYNCYELKSSKTEIIKLMNLIPTIPMHKLYNHFQKLHQETRIMKEL